MNDQIPCPYCKHACIIVYDYDDQNDRFQIESCPNCHKSFVLEYEWHPIILNLYTLQRFDPSEGETEVSAT